MIFAGCPRRKAPANQGTALVRSWTGGTAKFRFLLLLPVASSV